MSILWGLFINRGYMQDRKKLPKKILVSGLIALVLLAIAASNTAVIRYIDTAYTQVLENGLNSRKTISGLERECNGIENNLVNMIMSGDSLEVLKLRKRVYLGFTNCDRYITSLENTSFPLQHRDLLMKLRASCLSYRQESANFIIQINTRTPQENSKFISSHIQKKYLSLLSEIDQVTQHIDYDAVQTSNTLSRQNNVAWLVIAGAGLVPSVIWVLSFIAFMFWLYGSFRKAGIDKR